MWITFISTDSLSVQCSCALSTHQLITMYLLNLQVEGSRSRKTSLFYIGKRCAFVYKAKSKKSSPTNSKHKSRVRAIWGKVTRTHGANGSVRARFTTNLPGDAIGKRVRIVSIKNHNICFNFSQLIQFLFICTHFLQMMYPSRI